MEAHKYHVDLEWKMDRKGEISSPVLDQKVEVATPPEFPKGMAEIWSPEHLFTAAVSSCFMTTFLAIAENSKLEFESLTCPAEGVLDKKD
ncbi:osmotically inducible protein OsmC, partial [Flavobacterium sp. IR1]